MDNAILGVVTRIIVEHGDDILSNMSRTNAILLDLAPQMKRERLLVRSFVEIDGYTTLKTADEAYPLAEKRMVNRLADTFCLEKSAALWITRIFAVALGYLKEADLPDPSSTAEELIPRNITGYLNGQVSIGKNHVLAVCADGTVFSGGDNSAYQCDTHDWRDIVAVAAGEAHSLGLRANGTVISTGSNAYDQCDVELLENIAKIYAFGNISYFVQLDGMVVSAGRGAPDLTEFTEIASLAAYPDGLIGIRTDGTLVLALTDEEDADAAWLREAKNVVQVISSYIDGSVILTADGRIYKSNEKKSYFAQWRQVAGIASVADGFAILGINGTVRVVPFDRTMPRIVSDADKWKDITAVFGGYKRLIGLTRDGTLKVAYTHQGWLWSNKAMAINYAAAFYPVGAQDE